jgi:hypothetical protein
MSDIEQTVLDEVKRFRAALPQLLTRYRDRWVVWKDGRVQSDHATLDEAYRAGLRKYGPKSGMVVKQVCDDPGPVPVTAGILFGLA